MRGHSGGWGPRPGGGRASSSLTIGLPDHFLVPQDLPALRLMSPSGHRPCLPGCAPPNLRPPLGPGHSPPPDLCPLTLLPPAFWVILICARSILPEPEPWVPGLALPPCPRPREPRAGPRTSGPSSHLSSCSSRAQWPPPHLCFLMAVPRWHQLWCRSVVPLQTSSAALCSVALAWLIKDPLTWDLFAHLGHTTPLFGATQSLPHI